MPFDASKPISATNHGEGTMYQNGKPYTWQPSTHNSEINAYRGFQPGDAGYLDETPSEPGQGEGSWAPATDKPDGMPWWMKTFIGTGLGAAGITSGLALAGALGGGAAAGGGGAAAASGGAGAAALPASIPVTIGGLPAGASSIGAIGGIAAAPAAAAPSFASQLAANLTSPSNYVNTAADVAKTKAEGGSWGDALKGGAETFGMGGATSMVPGVGSNMSTGMNTKDWINLGTNVGGAALGAYASGKQSDKANQLAQAQLEEQKRQFDAQQAQQGSQFNATQAQGQANQALNATQLDPFTQQKQRASSALVDMLVNHYSPTKYENGAFTGGVHALTPEMFRSAVAPFTSQGAMQSQENAFNANAGAASGGKFTAPSGSNVGYGSNTIPTGGAGTGSASTGVGGGTMPSFSDANPSNASTLANNLSAGYDTGKWDALPDNVKQQYQNAGGAPGQNSTNDATNPWAAVRANPALAKDPSVARALIDERAMATRGVHASDTDYAYWTPKLAQDPLYEYQRMTDPEGQGSNAPAQQQNAAANPFAQFSTDGANANATPTGGMMPTGVPSPGNGDQTNLMALIARLMGTPQARMS